MKTIALKYFFVICLISVFAISCKNEKESESPDPETKTASAKEMKNSVKKSADLKYNPEHGIEGHRCDLPVGAPLANADEPKPMTESPLRIKGAGPTINPPHGQPGHDCSVAVGARLN